MREIWGRLQRDGSAALDSLRAMWWSEWPMACREETEAEAEAEEAEVVEVEVVEVVEAARAALRAARWEGSARMIEEW